MMFRTQTIGERTLGAIQEGLEKGREIMDLAIGQGQQAMKGILTSQNDRRGGEGWLWFAGGMLAGVAAAAGWRRSGAVRLAFRGRRVGDVMISSVQTIESSNSLTQAAQRMRDYNVGVLPVVEGGRLKGIVTDRDLVVRGMASGADPASVRVADCATHSLIAARADWPLQRAMETMATHQIGRLPVIDETDHIVGIVTLSSMALRAPQQHEALNTAKEVSRRSARAV
jgi:CBS domain-containing protein